MLLLTPVDTYTRDDTPATHWQWTQSVDGRNTQSSGEGLLQNAPLDAECVLVVPAQRLSWHRVQLPRVSGARLRATLEGLLEDRLLDEPHTLHFALEPDSNPGAPDGCWVAVCQKAWLNATLHSLSQANQAVTRIVPAAYPQANSSVTVDCSDADTAWCLAARPDGVLVLPMHMGNEHNTASAATQQALRHWLASDTAQPDNVEAIADARGYALAEHSWPELRWSIGTATDNWLQAVRQGWNLAQFDIRLSARHPKTEWLRRAARVLWHDPQWRPARWALMAILAVQTLGLNAVAWQERHVLQAMRNEQNAVLKQTFPHVTLILDPPVQMQRELDGLRQQLGQSGPGDLEYLLQTLASGSSVPLQFQSLEFSSGQATLVDWSLSQPDQLPKLQSALRAQGWRGEPTGKRWTLTQGGTP